MNVCSALKTIVPDKVCAFVGTGDYIEIPPDCTFFEGEPATYTNLLSVLNYGVAEGYTELEYLKSSGTQYIDTGVVTDGHYTIACRMQISYGTAWGRVQTTIGNGWDKPNSWARYLGGNNAGLNFIYQRQGVVLNVSTDSSSPSWDLAAPHDWVAKEDQAEGRDAVVTLDGQKVITKPMGGSTLNSSNPELLSHYIFWANGVYRYGNGKAGMQLYRFTMSTGDGVTVFDGVPALRLADNVAGMWDKVSKTFFTNAGSGTFGWQLKNVPAAAAYTLRGRSKPGYMPPSGVWARPAGVNELEIVADTEEVSGEGWLHFANTAEAYEHFNIAILQ